MASQPMARVLINDATIVGAGVVRRYPADPGTFQLGRRADMGEVDLDYTALVGYVVADQAGVLEVWQSGQAADVNGVAPVADATLVDAIVVPAATLTPITVVIRAPFGRVEFTDGGAGNTVYRLFLRAIQ